MAFYDAATYDSGAHYDEAAVPVNPHKKMAKVKLNLRSKTDDELSAFCTNHKTKMAGNAAFPTPDPTAAVYDAALATFVAKLAAVRALEDSLAQAVAEKDMAREALELVTSKRGNYVDNASNGEEAPILSAGFDVRATGAPIGELPAPQNLVATMGDNEGEVDLGCNRVRGAASYVFECRLYNQPGGPWQQVKISKKSSTTVTGMVSGTKYAFRVRAVGAEGEGAWSDEAVVMAP
jgi:Fibronectin type III domain